MKASRPNYAIIVGNGRSGSSWLLDLFDLSHETFCRNEPDGIDGSPFAQIDRFGTICRRDDRELADRWDQIVRWTVTHIGERDRPVRGPKRHLWPASRHAGLYRLVRSRRLRRFLSIALPSLHKGEWSLSLWLGSDRRLMDAFAILKLIVSPGWASFVLQQRPTVPVIHLVRHPCGFLNSWRNRYLAKHDLAKVSEANRQRLREVTVESPSWIDRFGTIAELSVEESQLWYWVYANETINSIGSQAMNYHLVLYEDLTSDAAGVMKRLWEVCGLSWSQTIEDSIATVSKRSSTVAARWRHDLSPDLVRLAEGILSHSAMKDWWRMSTSAQAFDFPTTAASSMLPPV